MIRTETSAVSLERTISKLRIYNMHSRSSFNIHRCGTFKCDRMDDWTEMMTLNWNLLKATFKTSEKNEITFSVTSTVAIKNISVCGTFRVPN